VDTLDRVIADAARGIGASSEISGLMARTLRQLDHRPILPGSFHISREFAEAVAAGVAVALALGAVLPEWAAWVAGGAAGAALAGLADRAANERALETLNAQLPAGVRINLEYRK
jgi:membrane associated rhomboid family serine protease